MGGDCAEFSSVIIINQNGNGSTNINTSTNQFNTENKNETLSNKVDELHIEKNKSTKYQNQEKNNCKKVYDASTDSLDEEIEQQEQIPFLNEKNNESLNEDQHFAQNKNDFKLNFSRIMQHVQILDDFVRFDVARTGALCCSGYRVSVQYEDEFLFGETGQSIWCFGSLFATEKSIRFSRKYFPEDDEENAINSSLNFHIRFPPRFFCFRPKRRKFRVILRLGDTKDEEELGNIEISSDFASTRALIEIHNETEKCVFKQTRLRANTFVINNEDDSKVGTVEVARGLRGGISSYGVSIVDDDISAITKALFISNVIAMDVEERESELTCSFFWTPMISIVIIILFTFLPWMYFHQPK